MGTRRRLSLPLILSLVLASCGPFGQKPKENAQTPAAGGGEPVPLSFATMGKINPDLAERLKKRFPEIEFQFVSLDVNQMSALYAQNKVPDIVLDLDRVLTPPHLLDKIQFDLSPLIKQHGLKLEAFEPGLIQHVKAYGDKGQIYALPYSRFLYGLFYNKNVFDKLGEPYPAENMNWDQVLELAKKMSRTDGGIAYRGLDPLVNDVGYIAFMDQFSLNLVDVATNKATTTSAEWKRMAALFRSIYDIPGNRPAKDQLFRPQHFYQNGTVAMTIGYSLDPLVRGARGGQNIDLVSYPVLPESPGVGPGTRTENLMITSSAQNKSKAFEVLKFLVSEEVQTENSRKGIGTVLNDERIMRVMGADVEAAKGKNVQALFRNKLPPIPAISKYEGAAFIAAFPFVPDLAMDEESVDDVLKKMETQINAAVAAERAKEAN